MSGVQTVIAIYCVVVTCVFIWYVASEREPVKTNKKVGELIEEAVLHDEIPWELVSRDRVRDVRLKNVEAKTTPYLLKLLESKDNRSCGDIMWLSKLMRPRCSRSGAGVA